MGCYPREIPRTILMGRRARIFRGRRPLGRPLNAVRPSSHLMVLQSPSIGPDIIPHRDGFADPDTLLEWQSGLTGILLIFIFCHFSILSNFWRFFIALKCFDFVSDTL